MLALLYEDASFFLNTFKVQQIVRFFCVVFFHKREQRVGSELVGRRRGFPKMRAGFPESQGAPPLDCGIKNKTGDNVEPFLWAQQDSNNQLASVKRASMAAPAPHCHIRLAEKSMNCVMFTREPLGFQRGLCFSLAEQPLPVFYPPLAAKCNADFSLIPAVCLVLLSTRSSVPTKNTHLNFSASVLLLLFLYHFYYIYANYGNYASCKWSFSSLF